MWYNEGILIASPGGAGNTPGATQRRFPVVQSQSIMFFASDIERFWAHVDRSGDCWLWRGVNPLTSYGTMRIGGRTIGVHRISYELHNGPIPDDKPFVCHTCDTPGCVNPAHLFAGTHEDNMKDKTAKGRQAKGETLGALIAQNTPRGDAHPARLHPELMARGDRHGSRIHIEKRPRGDGHYSRLHPERLARGESVATAKLTWAIVGEIRQRAANGETGTALARCYGVAPCTVLRILRGETWKEVAR